MMRIIKILQFLLLGLTVIGVFAAMARNNYGFTLIALACFGLALLFLVEPFWKKMEDQLDVRKKDLAIWIESILLAALLTLFGLRAFYIYLPGGEFIFIAVCLLLITSYLILGFNVFTDTKKQNTGLALVIIAFYSSILLFLVSMLLRISPFWSLLFGGLGVLASVPFLWSIFRQQKYEISGKLMSLFQFVVTSKNKAGLLFLFFIFSGLYTGLTQVGMIPQIENTDRPKVYIELIERAEGGNEKPAQGQYQHEKYKKAMDKFLDRHGKK